MPNNYNIQVSNEVDKAIKKKALRDNIQPIEVLDHQVKYYLACALYDDLETTNPINTPGLSIQQRLEVMAVATNQGVGEALIKAQEFVDLNLTV